MDPKKAFEEWISRRALEPTYLDTINAGFKEVLREKKPHTTLHEAYINLNPDKSKRRISNILVEGPANRLVKNLGYLKRYSLFSKDNLYNTNLGLIAIRQYTLDELKKVEESGIYIPGKVMVGNAQDAIEEFLFKTYILGKKKGHYSTLVLEDIKEQILEIVSSCIKISEIEQNLPKLKPLKALEEIFNQRKK